MVVLASTKLFRDLKPEELAALRQVAQEKTYSSGQDIFREGDPGDAMTWCVMRVASSIRA